MKIDRALQERLQATAEQEPDREIPVIVTVAPGSDVGLLAQSGLRIEHVFGLISAVSGTVRASDVAQLAQLEAVVRVEYDAPVRAAGA
ncbi:MAG: hypothetical protein JXA09_06080 [Anaerolineae bacterium]|nr:hypothetical protein [Anaerolineae bacterium]